MAIGDIIQNHFTTETDQFTGIKAVSYTHLDVYKRQEQNSSDCVPAGICMS